MPIWLLVAGLCGAGIIYTPVYLLIKKTLTFNQYKKSMLLIMILAGILMRLAFFSSTPILEDDYQRYMWDGAVLAQGINPYRYAPADFKVMGEAADRLKSVSALTSPTLSRINHPELRTIYPPVTQVFFAASYLISPFNLTIWRSILLAADLATLVLILLILNTVGRPAIWAAMYWWNPLVLKELFNSVHMEALLLPFLLGAIYLSISKLYRWSGVTLILAAGVKVWPIALYPILLRPLFNRPVKLFVVITPAIFIGLLMLWPILVTTLDSNSGFIAYATKWKTNSALFPVINNSFHFLTGSIPVANALTRLCIIVTLMIIIAALFIPSVNKKKETLNRCAIIVTTIFLLSPAQFPWYFVWVAPLMAFYNSYGLLILTILMPLYYLAFYFIAHGEYSIYQNYIIFVIWLPAWAAFIIDYLKFNNRLLLFSATGNNV